MTHEDAFLQDILENREDDTPRRIFADWLLDQHDPVRVARGEFIHVQCELARLRPHQGQGGGARAEMVRRERQLLEAHGREWGSLFPRLGCACWEYRRGFVEGVGMSAPAFLLSAATLCRSTPLRTLKLYDASAPMAELACCPFLARVEILDLEKNELGDADLEVLSRSPYLGELSTLLLWGNRIGDVGLAALASAAPPRLSRLDLSSNIVGDEGIAALALSPLLGRLHLLDLTGNQVGDEGAGALAASPFAETLGRLDLTKNPVGQLGQALLRQRYAGRVQVWG